MSHLKALILVLLTTLTTPALADQESFKLYDVGHWKVFYVVDDTKGPFCAIENAADGISFALEVSSNSVYAFYRDDALDLGSVIVTGRTHLYVDRGPLWDTPATGIGHSILMDGLAEDFLIEFQHGNRLYVDIGQDGEWDAWFSLHGSRAAIAALADCKTKL